MVIDDSNPSHRGERLTPWLAGAERPARGGVYRRRFPAGPYTCWDGAHWRVDSATVAAAAAQERSSRWQDAAWRGRVEPAPAPCPTCGGRTVIDRGVDEETGIDLIAECPDC
jgi:hypothetical protein